MSGEELCDICQLDAHVGYVSPDYSSMSGWLCANCCLLAYLSRSTVWPKTKEPFL